MARTHNLLTPKVDSMFACQAGSTRSNLTAAQVSNPPLPALCCLHEKCLEGEPAVYTLIQCTPYLTMCWWLNSISCNWLNRYISLARRNLRSDIQGKLPIPWCIFSQVRNSSIRYSGPGLWNELPHDIRNAITLEVFKTSINIFIEQMLQLLICFTCLLCANYTYAFDMM